MRKGYRARLRRTPPGHTMVMPFFSTMWNNVNATGTRMELVWRGGLEQRRSRARGLARPSLMSSVGGRTEEHGRAKARTRLVTRTCNLCTVCHDGHALREWWTGLMSHAPLEVVNRVRGGDKVQHQ